MNVMIKNSILPITCSVVSFSTLYYIINDNHTCQLKQQAKKYENKIKTLEEEAIEMKKKYNYHLSEQAIKGILK
jgi:hypothetical protein